MEEQQRNVPDVDAATLEKLDGGMRRLLFERDESLRAAVEAEQRRLEASLRRIAAIEQVLPVTASIADRQYAAKVKAMHYAKLEPNALYGAVRAGARKLEPVKLRALIKFAGNRDDLVAMGLEVGMQAQDIFTVTGTAAQLPVFSRFHRI